MSLCVCICVLVCVSLSVCVCVSAILMCNSSECNPAIICVYASWLRPRVAELLLVVSSVYLLVGRLLLLVEICYCQDAGY